MKISFFILFLFLQLNLVFAQNNCDIHFLKTLTLKLSGKASEDEMVAVLSGDKLTAFEHFLSQKNISLNQLTQTQKRNYYFESLEEEFSRFKNEDFAAQEKNLSRYDYLKNRGYKMVGTDAKNILEKQSAKNLKRALDNNPKHTYGKADLLEVESKLSNLQFHFLHNTQFLSRETSIPILSSKRLEDIVGAGGLNSRFSFNKSIMKSDDSVYFVIQPNVDGKFHASSSEYGAYSMYLNDNYANEFGMVSSFVMYEEELYLWGELNAPDIIKKMKDETIGFYTSLTDDEQFNFKEIMRIDWMYSIEQGQFKLGNMLKRAHEKANVTQSELMIRWKNSLSPHLTELRQNLYKTDYTPSDFSTGLKEILLQEFDKLSKDEIVHEFQKLNSSFTQGHWKYSPILNRALGRLGIPNDGMTTPLELTIPVNVPADKINLKE